jgi:UDP-2,3-diacylglucosamine hydrolase
MSTRNKLYFASDFHLGVGNYAGSREREDRLVRWLDEIKADAAEVFLMGDVFDFWFEYASVVPRGYVRFLGKLAELADEGIKLYFFKGNHDMWMFNYLEEEVGATIISDELIIERSGKKFYLHHGDGLGPGDGKYKLMKRFFRSGVCQWLFARIHPNFGVGLANYFSRRSRMSGETKPDKPGYWDEQRWLITFCNELLKTQYFDYLVFGHRHKPLDILLDNKKSRYINLGEWVNRAYTYAVFDGEALTLVFAGQPVVLPF